MLKTLAFKELRETSLVALAALVVYAYVVGTSMGFSLLPGLYLLPYVYADEQVIPFLGGGIEETLALVSAGFAIALGLRQSAGESMRDTFLFLLHRPVRWERTIGVKLLTGAAVYGVCASLPILLYGWWAATPGTHASPFCWSMTLPAWRVCVSLTAIYLGAFLSGIRPGAWIGTRLLPLAAAGGLTWRIQALPSWWIWGLAAVAVMDVVLAASILFVARTRDYS
jgi:hypothetical protein